MCRRIPHPRRPRDRGFARPPGDRDVRVLVGERVPHIAACAARARGRSADKCRTVPPDVRSQRRPTPTLRETSGTRQRVEVASTSDRRDTLKGAPGSRTARRSSRSSTDDRCYPLQATHPGLTEERSTTRCQSDLASLANFMLHDLELLPVRNEVKFRVDSYRLDSIRRIKRPHPDSLYQLQVGIGNTLVCSCRKFGKSDDALDTLDTIPKSQSGCSEHHACGGAPCRTPERS